MIDLDKVLKHHNKILKIAKDVGLIDVKIFKSFDPHVLCIFAKPLLKQNISTKAIVLSYLLSNLLKCQVTVITPEDILERDKIYLDRNTALVSDIKQIKTIFGETKNILLNELTEDYVHTMNIYRGIYERYSKKQKNVSL